MSRSELSVAHEAPARDLALGSWYDTVKRILDITVALALLTIPLPLWLVIAAAIKLTSPGPVFYVADTVGKNGRVFRLYKFRTMRANNDESEHHRYLERFVERNEPYTVIRREDGKEQRVYKIVDDKRVTVVGRILRSTGLDEAPQIINVLKGDMSMVGPRPPRPAEYGHYEEWHKQRLSVLPGITGLYQVTARSVVPFDEMVRIDLEYIRSRSLWLDLKIMLLTPINVIILRKGGY
ncbi:MAG: sugar transferase [candidate division KSB1 bacterium]|nr:sugar transferase [candidate division KSB1 bacterium]